MKLFLKKRKDDFKILADEHIKKIEFEKIKCNPMGNNKTYEN
jgi:hypothetical protein